MRRKAMKTIYPKLIIEEKPAKLTGIVTLDNNKQRQLRAFLQNLTAKGEHKPKSGSTRIITAELITGEE